MKLARIIGGGLFAACIAAANVSAQQPPADPPPENQVPLEQGPTAAEESTSLDDLTILVGEGRTADTREFQQRLEQFRQEQDLQEQRLNDARAELARQEQISVDLNNEFDSNDLLIVEVRAQYNERLGDLQEIFGVLQQFAGDARSSFNNSLTNIEFPDRDEFLGEFAAKMSESNELPTIEEINRLWFEIVREANELGKVKRIPNQRVITADGEEVNETVVRVGAFNIVADGRYLTHVEDTNSVVELQRQPPARYVDSTSALLNAPADGGLVRFGIDVTRGQLLELLIETPDQLEQIQQGGTTGYIIIGLGILGVLLSLERLITLGFTSRKVSSQLKSDTPKKNNPLGRVLMVYHENKNTDSETLELKLGEAILREQPPLIRGILFIKIISVVAPLLGLLGTVVGMIQTFQVIMLFGAGDPSRMAGGISTALQTTKLGLIVAIPMVLLHTIVNGRSRRIMQVLQEQSAGLVARQAEASA